jgi:hypothetical protein
MTPEQHVMPLDDVQEHAASRTCWCKPTPDTEVDSVFIHHRWSSDASLFAIDHPRLD